MEPERFSLAVSLLIKTDLHISGQGRTLPLVDRSVEVNWGGVPFIPASSFRGRVRAYVERLLKTSGHPVCSPPHPERMCPHNEEVVDELKNRGVSEPFCIACRIFGSPWRDTAVTFSDLTIRKEGALPKALPLRTGVSVNRRTGAAEAERLFVMETVPYTKYSRFEGVIEGTLPKDELGWLIAGVRAIDHIGGNKSRGLGRTEVEITSLKLGKFADNKWNFVEGNWKDILREVVEHGAAQGGG